MNTVRKSVSFLLSTMLCVGFAQAMAEETEATLMEVTGTVLVNQGKVYQPAQSGMKLSANTRVLTKDKAGAAVTSKQGCVTRLGANSLFVVKQPDPCHGGATAQKVDPAAYASVTESGAGAATGGAAGTGPGGLSTNTMVAIGAGTLAVGGILGGLAGSGEFDDNSSSRTTTPAAAYQAVINSGGSVTAARAAFGAAANGGTPVQIANAVLLAGGTQQQAAAGGFGTVLLPLVSANPISPVNQ